MAVLRQMFVIPFFTIVGTKRFASIAGERARRELADIEIGIPVLTSQHGRAVEGRDRVGWRVDSADRDTDAPGMAAASNSSWPRRLMPLKIGTPPGSVAMPLAAARRGCRRSRTRAAPPRSDRRASPPGCARAARPCRC
mgnify:CR=1 FL=1